MPDDNYLSALQNDARNLVAAAADLAVVEFRESEIAAVLAELDRGRSVLLVGPTGVGKTAVIHGVAAAMAARGRGGIFELSTALLLAGTRYIGEWQTKVTRIADAAARANAALYVTDAWNLSEVGITSSSRSSILDALRPSLESARLRLLAEATPEVLRTMQRVPGFVPLFRTIEIAPLADDRVETLLDRAAERRNTRLDPGSRRAMIKVTSRFLAARPQPGPALALLGEAVDYQDQKRSIGEEEAITPAFVERVFSITSGLPPFIVSRSVVKPAAEIRAWFADRIVGQLDAIDAVVEMIALFKAGLHDPNRPIGTFLFVGPTGVGKTELARAMATFLFGSPQRLLRFDLSEFKDYSAFELLLGDPEHPHKPARLIDPVRSHPFQVVLFDELEKAHPNMWDLLLPLLDEGRLTTPSGDTVDFRNTILIATSNVGAQAARPTVGFGSKAPEGDGDAPRIQKALEVAFRPEFLNRFQHVIVFHSLSQEQMRQIARQEMGRVLEREGIAGRGLVVDVDDDAIDLVIREGIDARFGARALKREVQRRIVLPLAMTLMEQEILPESILKVTARDDKLRIRVVATEESRAHARELEPVRGPSGRPITRADVSSLVTSLRERMAELAATVDEPALEVEHRRILRDRARQSSWKDVEKSDALQRDFERVDATLDRLRRTRERVDDLASALAAATSRSRLDAVALQARTVDQAFTDAHLELRVIGWDGSWDAVVEVRTLGSGSREARDLLIELYLGWAKLRRFSTDWLREPRDDDEPALVAIRGLHAYGWLKLEAGLHRLRLAPTGRDDDRGRLVVGAVRVLPWIDHKRPVMVSTHRPLKATGQYGGKIRSRVECEGLVLQNHRTIAENRELAADLVEAWAHAPAWSDEVVRRYDRSPPLVRDALTGFSSGRPEGLTPAALDALLRRRLEATPR
jgi:ATP-dependent Clp protease ATP-binding subunit ClpC